MGETTRRYDLDWLRVLVFGLLICYHVGMFFVPWDWHFKNNQTYGWLAYPMLFLNQWRLPILFVISGMGTYFALGKRSTWAFVKERFWRLWVPLGVGMFVIVPPQVYLERVVKGDFVGGYFDWWPVEAFVGIYPSGNMSWHHLWFLPYLLLFSWLLAPAFVYLKNHPGNHIQWLTNRLLLSPWSVYGFLLPIFLAESFLEPFFPETKALVGDWFTIGYNICFFFFGFLVMLNGEGFWSLTKRYRHLFLINGIVGFISLIGIRMFLDDSMIV
ncbi:MAG: acyltransferase family protein, partial [Bacteroidota bacterium]